LNVINQEVFIPDPGLSAFHPGFEDYSIPRHPLTYHPKKPVFLAHPGELAPNDRNIAHIQVARCQAEISGHQDVSEVTQYHKMFRSARNGFPTKKSPRQVNSGIDFTRDDIIHHKLCRIDLGYYQPVRHTLKKDVVDPLGACLVHGYVENRRRSVRIFRHHTPFLKQ
jgi:hypothetical protein